ncbi:TetR/AcrR family transcriptional regulator [Mycobacterium neumannii]|uniref:TetR/AcrR family transcriptional regulator n=1 Tax=Mycobacterium neumannii TaxID=2048551 RepID=UPI003AB33AAC
MAEETALALGPRGRGRPVGSDSAETRANILRAARAVINERGYEAATFKAVAVRAGISRPTMHYYFATKEDLYDCLQREAYAAVSASIAAAKQRNTLLEQLTAFITAAGERDPSDGSMMRFVIASRLEQHRHPGLRGSVTPVAEAVADFYTWMVEEAMRRGEIPEGVDIQAVVNMLSAMFWGMGFFGRFVHGSEPAIAVAKQLNRLLRRGLLPSPASLAV